MNHTLCHISRSNEEVKLYMMYMQLSALATDGNRVNVLGDIYHSTTGLDSLGALLGISDCTTRKRLLRLRDLGLIKLHHGTPISYVFTDLRPLSPAAPSATPTNPQP
jgi:hypothetical protein